MRKIGIIALIMALALLTACAAGTEAKYPQYANMTAEEIVSQLTLSQKISQMLLPACYYIDSGMMQANCYGGSLSAFDRFDADAWRRFVDKLQSAAVESEAGIPFIYGQDDVHGVNYCAGAVIFPHNIGLGAANDEELMVEVGRITADEAKLCHMLWNFAPCLAQSVDPRWGRTYESYGADLDCIARLGAAYTRGLVEGGVVACAKHFLADGNVAFGTGENPEMGMLLDRGDATLSDGEIDALFDVYRALLEAGAQTVMISHSSLNGVKMHENAEMIGRLKAMMGPDRFIVSDWDSVQNTSPDTYYDQIVTAVNAGIDMLMEVERFDEARQIIADAVAAGDIPEARVDDAARRIIQVKLDAGIIADPFGKKLETAQPKTGSAEYRAVAENLVEESLVLLKNENGVLPLKAGAKVYVLGPAADDAAAQCGGWTMEWNGSEQPNIPGVTTLLKGLKDVAREAGITVVADPDEADVVLLAVGEHAYAEWNGDTDDPDLCGPCGLPGNAAAIEKARALGKPVVACVIAGRQVFIRDYIDDWDAAVMCYLPGSEGQGIANALCGRAPFTGRTPSPWYGGVDEIGTGACWLEAGYGLSIES